MDENVFLLLKFEVFGEKHVFYEDFRLPDRGPWIQSSGQPPDRPKSAMAGQGWHRNVLSNKNNLFSSVLLIRIATDGYHNAKPPAKSFP